MFEGLRSLKAPAAASTLRLQAADEGREARPQVSAVGDFC